MAEQTTQANHPVQAQASGRRHKSEPTTSSHQDEQLLDDDKVEEAARRGMRLR